MPLPASAPVFEESMDPGEFIDFKMAFFDPSDVASSVLEEGEQINAFYLTLEPEAVAVGLTIEEAQPNIPKLVDDATAIQLWFYVATESINTVDFKSGVTVGINVRLWVSDAAESYSRVRERTFGLTLIEQ